MKKDAKKISYKERNKELHRCIRIGHRYKINDTKWIEGEFCVRLKCRGCGTFYARKATRLERLGVYLTGRTYYSSSEYIEQI